MEKVKGMVMKTTGKNVYVMTPDGRFVKGNIEGKTPLPGEEVEIMVATGTERSTKRPRMALALVAALLIFFIGFGAFQYMTPPSIAAYMEVSINPSLELALDNSGHVLKTVPLNDDASQIAAGLQLKGLHAEQALKKLLEAAERKGFINPEKENIIQITLAAEKDYSINEEELENIVISHLEDEKITASYKISKANLTDREEARRKNISLNRLVMEKESKKKKTKEKPFKAMKKYNPKGQNKEKNQKEPKGKNKSNEMPPDKDKKDRIKPDRPANKKVEKIKKEVNENKKNNNKGPDKVNNKEKNKKDTPEKKGNNDNNKNKKDKKRNNPPGRKNK